MHIISSCIILYNIIILNNLCQGEEIKNWGISFTPAKVTAVPGVCVVISCTFTNTNEAKPDNLMLYQCKNETQYVEGTEETKVKKFDLDKNNCNININNISAEDEGEYEIREKGNQSYTDSPRFKIIIQDAPVINITALTEGQEANLSCSAPAPCPKTPPEIIWRINLNEKNIKLKKITFTTSQGFYISNLTFTPTTKLQNATFECEARYGNISISTSTTIKVICASNMNQSHNIEDFFQSLGLSRVHTLLVGIATSAVFFSVVLCCWVSCNRTKKPEVLAAPPDSAVHLEAVQTNIDSAVNDEQTNEETPLQNQFDVEMSSTQVEMTGLAEEGEAGGADVNVDYAAIDYSLLKKKPEEEEEETANTDYAEIKRDTKGRKDPQDQDDQVEMANEGYEIQQNEGEERLYSNSQELEILA